MRQRLGIAVALLGEPRALLLDEPTAALDPSGALDVRDILRGIRADGIAVLLSSHDLAEVGVVAQRVGIFVAGRLEALGTTAELARAADVAPDLEAIYRAITGVRPRLVA
jgi:ABC-type multidrug transport system ATPase subunit